jgi:hypothetical protein
MRFVSTLLLFLLISYGAASATEPGHPAVNIYILRGAEQLSSPHVVTYRLFEWSQMRGRWILPDFGYYDSGYAKDQIWFVGGGADIVRRKRFTWEQEIYLSQEAGPQAHNQRSIWLWPVLDFAVTRKIYAQAVAYPTIPINRSQKWGYDVDRVKIERTIGSRWRAGFGYAGGVCSGNSWRNEPFAAVTRTTRAGNFEFWLQKVPDGTQAQFRYLLVRSEN